MPNITAIQELVNGPRHLVLKLDIEGDGSSEIDSTLVAVGNYGCEEVRLDSIKGQTSGFQLVLEWDGSTRAPLTVVEPGNYIDLAWGRDHGLVNPKVTNYTGDVRMTTIGLDNSDTASLTLHFFKKRLTAPAG